MAWVLAQEARDLSREALALFLDHLADCFVADVDVALLVDDVVGADVAILRVPVLGVEYDSWTLGSCHVLVHWLSGVGVVCRHFAAVSVSVGF